MNRKFRDDVYNLVCAIPKGRVMTYGQIAALCGHPNAARVVGQIAHFGPEYIPWHRVVNCKGGMARGFSWGGKTGQGRLLSEEGVKIIDDYLILANYLWWPEK
ncbi:MGMT family protein [Candidatus Saccharibacteria bacterium]|nr:MGMT family protein [Candidatus Saccharibacteria bacterium]HPW47730.1 methylated-DNA--[protein]-cysteine S-methyltransferase [Candidatus Saccharibacteria bacterium]